MAMLDMFKVDQIKAELDAAAAERDRLKDVTDVLRKEIERLNSELAHSGRMTVLEKQQELADLEARQFQLYREMEAAQNKANEEVLIRTRHLQLLDININERQSELIVLDEELLLQSFGFYRLLYSLGTSAAYKERMEQIRAQQAAMVKQGAAARGAEGWRLNNSLKEGEKMVKDYVKLILRSFNNECDASIVNVKFNNIASIEKKIRKAFETLNKLGERMTISISQDYLSLKMEELHLCHEYEVKRQDEKEEQKRLREQMREEAKAQREIEEAKAKLAKEEKHFGNALIKVEAQLAAAKSEAEKQALQEEKTQIESKMAEVVADKASVELREQNTRAGHVYIISNVGSFGEEIYKIGVTRRLDPLERVDELGDASVPFDFDIHALIFSHDAPALENALHKTFAERRLNKINLRREFFRVSLEEIEQVVKTNYNKPVEFIRTAEASHFRQSLKLKESATG